MNEELQKALAELLGKASSGIDTASNFLVSELPDVIQQLLMWHGVYSFILFLFATVFIPTGIAFIFKAFSGKDKEGHWAYTKAPYDPMSINGVLVLLLSVVILVVGFVMLNFKWLMIWIAPKVWLLEYAARLTN